VVSKLPKIVIQGLCYIWQISAALPRSSDPAVLGCIFANELPSRLNMLTKLRLCLARAANMNNFCIL